MSGPRRGLLWPSLFWLGLVAILAALGTWQVQRLHWKEGLIAQLNATMTRPPARVARTGDSPQGT